MVFPEGEGIFAAGPPETVRLPYCGKLRRMTRYRTIGEVEADLIALRAATERAGMALACLFSSSDEYEADLIRERRAQGAYLPPRRTRHRVGMTVLVATLVVAFLMI